MRSSEQKADYETTERSGIRFRIPNSASRISYLIRSVTVSSSRMVRVIGRAPSAISS